MEKTFSENDYRLRVCSRDEIGQPWEDRWSMDDFVMKICSMGQVGKPKNPKQSEPEQFRSLTNAERKRLLVEMADKLLVEAHANPSAFASDSGPQLNRFLDMTQRLLIDEDASPDLASIAINKLRALPVVDRYRSLLAPIISLPDEHRTAVFASWGLQPADLAELLDEMQAAAVD